MMKTPLLKRKSFELSFKRINSYRAIKDFEFALFESGFNCGVRETKKINKPMENSFYFYNTKEKYNQIEQMKKLGIDTKNQTFEQCVNALIRMLSN